MQDFKYVRDIETGKLIRINKGEFNQIKRGIANTIKILGFSTASKEIMKAKTHSKVKRQVDFVIKHELRVGSGGKYLHDPVTRKKSLNPMRPKWLRLQKKFNTALNMLEVAEKMEKN